MLTIQTSMKQTKWTHQNRPRRSDGFRWSTLSLKAPSPFPRHMRVVPTKKSLFHKEKSKEPIQVLKMRPNWNRRYPEQRELQYLLYGWICCLKFLKPKVLDWSDKRLLKNAMCVYLVEMSLYFLYTNRHIFSNTKLASCWRIFPWPQSIKLCMEIDIMNYWSFFKENDDVRFHYCNLLFLH